MGTRRYTEKEIGDVLRRAAEMQAAEAADQGASAAEIRAAAREIGIAPEYVERALASQLAPRRKPGFWGGPRVLELSSVCEGKLDGVRWEETVADLRETFGEEGNVVSRDSAYEWTGSGGGFRSTQLTVRETERGSRAVITVRADGMAFMVYFVLTFGLGVLAVLLARTGGPAALMLWPALTSLASRTILTWSARAVEKRSRDFLDRLERRLSPETAVSAAHQTSSTEDTEIYA